MIIIQNATYIHPNKDILFQEINLTIADQEKIALIGNNGSGKSTLLKVIAGQLQLNNGTVSCDSIPYYIPQMLDEYKDLTIAAALGIEEKLRAFKEILLGNMTEHNLDLLNDDWSIEDRCQNALSEWKLTDISLDHKIGELSGGQKTKVFLAGITIQEPQIILMDEPSNHLDHESRELLYQFIKDCRKTLLVVSHDRTLLNLIPEIAEMTKQGIVKYGGNYEFFAEQKEQAMNALDHDVKSKEKELRKAREKEKEALERQNKLNARGKKKQEKAGIPKILMGGLKNKAEGSSGKLKTVHEEKISGIRMTLQDLRTNLPEIDQMKFGFEESSLHIGKTLAEAKEVNLKINGRNLWHQNLNFKIKSGDRIALKGTNGSGKTSLINLIIGNRQPTSGEISQANFNYVYVDQDYSLIKTEMKVYDMAQSFNHSGLQEHEIKIRLNRFLFSKDTWDKSCLFLSGGERMRLLLCCLNIQSQAPDMIILDEPTNNIDIQNIQILTAAIQSYHGCLIVVSHDQYFMNEINIQETIQLG